MRLNLSEMSPLPLREQIVRRIREMILSGEMPEHFQLPSIRSLARSERVGIVTVQRAYEDLEREQVVYARQGKGYFVRPIAKLDRAVQAADLARNALQGPLGEAHRMGLSPAAILALVRKILADLSDNPQQEDH